MVFRMDGTRVLGLAAVLGILLMVSDCIEANIVTADEPISEMLAKFGLPIGLMPDSIKSYSLADDGKFKVELAKPCYVQFDYLVYYDKTITGKVSYGKITDLSGIQAKQFFIWVDVTGMEMDLPASDYIYFKVGIISKKIEISWFETVPTCKDKLGKEPCNEAKAAVSLRDVQ